MVTPALALLSIIVQWKTTQQSEFTHLGCSASVKLDSLTHKGLLPLWFSWQAEINEFELYRCYDGITTSANC